MSFARDAQKGAKVCTNAFNFRSSTDGLKDPDGH